ncbi:hypothetical protein [Priestia megaterium]|uniref:hypothetical protein n=1 Tax=Priestia megaterium TaxID=1404 RepID=UPI0012B6B084|nr:hypothetical protein [Priestia megaterium]
MAEATVQEMQEAIINNFKNYCAHHKVSCEVFADEDNVQVEGDYRMYINILSGQANITIFKKMKNFKERHGFALANIVFRLCLSGEYSLVFTQMADNFYNYTIKHEVAEPLGGDSVQLINLLPLN